MRCDAVTHILYAALSMTLSMLAMRQWFQFEERVKDGRLLELPLGGLDCVTTEGDEVCITYRFTGLAPERVEDLRRSLSGFPGFSSLDFYFDRAGAL